MLGGSCSVMDVTADMFCIESLRVMLQSDGEIDYCRLMQGLSFYTPVIKSPCFITCQCVKMPQCFGEMKGPLLEF